VGVRGIEYVHTCGVVHGVPIKDTMMCVVFVCVLCGVRRVRVPNGNQKRNRRNILETLEGATWA
jgi:hypothetical protein